MPLPKVSGYPYWDRRPEPCPIVVGPKARPYRLSGCTYRGVAGWKITGGPGVFPVSIFFEHESAARRTIGRLRASPGSHVETIDFRPDWELERARDAEAALSDLGTLISLVEELDEKDRQSS